MAGWEQLELDVGEQTCAQGKDAEEKTRKKETGEEASCESSGMFSGAGTSAFKYYKALMFVTNIYKYLTLFFKNY